MRSNIVTKGLGLEGNIFGFLIYYIFNRNSGKALSAVIWFKFHSTFCIWPNSLISSFLVFCCASLLAVDTLIYGFHNKILASTEGKEKKNRKKRKSRSLDTKYTSCPRPLCDFEMAACSWHNWEAWGWGPCFQFRGIPCTSCHSFLSL